MLVIGCVTAWHTAQTCMLFLARIQAGLLAYCLKSTTQHLESSKDSQSRSQTTKSLLFGGQNEGPAQFTLEIMVAGQCSTCCGTWPAAA